MSGTFITRDEEQHLVDRAREFTEQDIILGMDALRPLKHAEYAKMDIKPSKRKKLSRRALRKQERTNKKRGRA